MLLQGGDLVAGTVTAKPLQGTNKEAEISVLFTCPGCHVSKALNDI